MDKTQLSAKIITLYPELFPGPLSASVTGRALKKRIWELETKKKCLKFDRLIFFAKWWFDLSSFQNHCVE